MALPKEFGSVEFSLWGAMQLNAKLRLLRENDVILLQYLGKEPGQQGQHRWSVRPFGGTTEQLRGLVKSYSASMKHVLAAIETLKRTRGAAARGRSESDDEDLPF